VEIHRKCVVHSDLALRQFLLDANDNARLSDFAASGYPGQCALGMECASHYLPRDPDLPNTVESDLFALGSVLYEVMAGETPYHGKSDKEIETLYKEENFPAVNKFLCGNVIMGCWKREWRSTEEVLARYDEYRRIWHIRSTSCIRSPYLYNDTQFDQLESTIFIRNASYMNDIYINNNN
jgi:serine/threonine protein kinase